MNRDVSTGAQGGPGAPWGAGAQALRAAFEETALPHLDALYGMALKLTRHPHEAEDLVQETMLRAFRFFHHYEPGTNIKAWLFRILRNGFINRWRAVRHEAPAVSLDDTDWDAPEGASPTQQGALLDPETALENAHLDRDLNRAILQLPAEFREALLLNVVEGFSYREVGKMLDVPIGTVMSRIHRARKLLQRALAGWKQAGKVVAFPGNAEEGGSHGMP